MMSILVPLVFRNKTNTDATLPRKRSLIHIPLLYLNALPFPHDHLPHRQIVAVPHIVVRPEVVR